MFHVDVKKEPEKPSEPGELSLFSAKTTILISASSGIVDHWRFWVVVTLLLPMPKRASVVSR